MYVQPLLRVPARRRGNVIQKRPLIVLGSIAMIIMVTSSSAKKMTISTAASSERLDPGLRSSSSYDDVDARVNRQRSAVHDQMVEPSVVLSLSIEEVRIVVPRPVDSALRVARGSRVGPVGDRLRDSGFDWSVEANAEHVCAAAEDYHAGAAKNHRASSIRDPLEDALSSPPKGVGILNGRRRHSGRGRHRPGCGECIGNPIPAGRGTFVAALCRILGKVQLMRHPQRNRPIEKGQSQTLRHGLGDAFAPRAVRR
jgi:hypothetical protein